jgi:hypothetical protein
MSVASLSPLCARRHARAGSTGGTGAYALDQSRHIAAVITTA